MLININIPSAIMPHASAMEVIHLKHPGEDFRKKLDPVTEVTPIKYEELQKNKKQDLQDLKRMGQTIRQSKEKL